MGHILGSIGALLVMILMFPQLITWWDTGNTLQQQRLIAGHMNAVIRATNQYTNKHQATLLATTGVSSGVSITIADLIADNLLPAGFSDTNVWLQNYSINIRQPQTGTLQSIIVTTDGRPNLSSTFLNVTVPGAAAMIGGSGGFTPSDAGVYPAGSLVGAGNGWVVSLSAVGVTDPGPGHVGAVVSYDGSALGQDYLYRIAVPGQPELNQMQTALDMTFHDINKVRSQQFEEREYNLETCVEEEDQGRVFLDKNLGLYMCRNNSLEIIGDSGNSTLIKEVTVLKNGDKVKKPTCATNTDTTPQIFTAPAMIEAGAEAPPMTAIQTWATSVSDTHWEIHARVQTPNKNLPGSDENGWVYPADDYNRILVMTTCAKPDTP